jgi:hypothetical protein
LYLSHAIEIGRGAGEFDQISQRQEGDDEADELLVVGDFEEKQELSEPIVKMGSEA